MSKDYAVGDTVMIDSFEGFGGPAKVIEVRDSPGTRYRVAMDDGSPPPFWAHDFEVSPPEPPAGGLYDSRHDTRKHIWQVAQNLMRVLCDLERRQREHDRSKLESPEKDTFDEFTPKLAATTYGSDEYKSYLAAMKPALDHHYAANSHHPEHYRWHCACCGGSFSAGQAPESEWSGGERHRFCPKCVGAGSVIWEAELLDRPDRGIRGMSLLDLIEMLCDWKAATLRHADGDIRRSIEVNQKRFGYSDELAHILFNTLSAIEA